MLSLDRLLTLDAELVKREPVDPLDPDAELGDVIVGTTKCELQHTTGGEVHDGRVMVTGWRLFLPADVELAGVDAIRLAGGEVLELEGDPWPVRHPLEGIVHHVEAAVRRAH